MKQLEKLSAIIITTGCLIFVGSLVSQYMPRLMLGTFHGFFSFFKLTWPCKSAVNISRIFTRIAAIFFVLSCINSGQAFGNDQDSEYQIISRPAQRQTGTITSGTYGPFSSYYPSSLILDDDICRLMGNKTNSFQIICFSAEISSGIALTNINESENIQATLTVVNSYDGKPMPELVILFSLAEMEQKFFTKYTASRLLNINSIFDEPCKLTYKIDQRPLVSKELYCSSFLNYFDKYTGASKLYYELRVRPTTLRSISKKSLIVEEDKDWFIFFETLLNHKEMKVTLELNGDIMVTDFILDLGASANLINKLLNTYYNNISKPQTENGMIKEKLFGPFDYMACTPNRYVAYVGSVGQKKRYKDIFLVNCDANALRVKPYSLDGKNMPSEWIYKVIEYTEKKTSANSTDLEELSIGFKMNSINRELPAFISINWWADSFFVTTSFRYPLTKIDKNLYYSQWIHNTMSDAFQPDTPCRISYIIDGKLASREHFNCNSAYHIVYRDIIIKVDVDYGFNECSRAADNACKKAALIKATSFLRKITSSTKEVIMEVEFETGDLARTTFDLADFDFEAVDRLFKSIAAFE